MATIEFIYIYIIESEDKRKTFERNKFMATIDSHRLILCRTLCFGAVFKKKGRHLKLVV